MIKGDKELEKKFAVLEQVAEEQMEKIVGRQAKRIQAEAKLLCPVQDGELRRSIKTKVQREGDSVTGVVYTNKKYAPYVEFGTGPKGEADHAGISPVVTPSYVQKPWWIHESQIGWETAEMYHMFRLDTADGLFYQTSGQAAQPFLYPALKNNEKRVAKNMEDALKRELRKALK